MLTNKNLDFHNTKENPSISARIKYKSTNGVIRCQVRKTRSSIVVLSRNRLVHRLLNDRAHANSSVSQQSIKRLKLRHIALLSTANICSASAGTWQFVCAVVVAPAPFYDDHGHSKQRTNYLMTGLSFSLFSAHSSLLCWLNASPLIERTNKRFDMSL